MSLLAKLKRERNAIIKIGSEHGLKNIRIFGSVPRNADTKDSDIDFLVELTEDAGLFDIIGFKQDVEDLLGRKVDVVTESALSPYIRDDVLKEAVDL